MLVTFTRKDMNPHEHAPRVVVTFDNIGYIGTITVHLGIVNYPLSYIPSV